MVRELAPYRSPRVARSVFELTVTLVPFLALSGLMFAAVEAGIWLALLLVPIAAGLLLRLFLIQHDCGHGAFFPNRAANDWVGRCLGVLTLTPYACWARSHALHHASAGNLDARGFGDVDTLTVREFHSTSRWRQMLYRFYRHPLVLLGLGPAYLFLLRHRLPIGLMTAGSRYWVSALGTNAATALILVALAGQFGLGSVLIVQLPVSLLAASVGVWLFYVQHQFEEAHWERDPRWSFHEAALHGSSHLELPAILRWFTANIGAHHVHHLASRVPYYRLPEVLADRPELIPLNRLTIRDTVRTFRLALWDEDQRRLVPFAAACGATSSNHAGPGSI
ncbi:MAG TPA: fatty acid desaturase [Pirellulaceae bacterium]|nr:fatty acid desaturase [Pirellulaceae bacterium]